MSVATNKQWSFRWVIFSLFFLTYSSFSPFCPSAVENGYFLCICICIQTFFIYLFCSYLLVSYPVTAINCGGLIWWDTLIFPPTLLLIQRRGQFLIAAKFLMRRFSRKLASSWIRFYLKIVNMSQNFEINFVFELFMLQHIRHDLTIFPHISERLLFFFILQEPLGGGD